MFKFVNNSQISPWQSETLMLKNRSSLCIWFSSNYGMKIRQYVLFKIKNSPSRKLHWERNHSFWKRLRVDWGQGFEVRFLSHGDLEFFVCPTLVTRRKDIFLYFFTELKTYHLSYYISKLFIFYITWIFGRCMLKIFGGHFVSTSSTARKTIKTILMKL